MFRVPNHARVQHPTHGSVAALDGDNGVFVLKAADGQLVCLASDGSDVAMPDQWEHVSVHVETPKGERTPTWEEMCLVKATFWDADDVVIQLHPARRDYVNRHPHTLHLWRAVNWRQPMPPKLFV